MSKLQKNISIHRPKNQKGFTLVELAIVLVIIGLIVSSVLVGQDLIKAAQLRATIRQYNEFQVGVNTFIGKYNAVPGDIAYATANSFGLSGNGGNGDGTITATTAASTPTVSTSVAVYSVSSVATEMVAFWGNLTTPGKELISGTYAGTGTTALATGSDFPAMKYGAAGWGVYGISGTNYFYAGAASPSTAAATTTANPFIPIDAYNIDAKIDDGLPNTGNVLAGSNNTTATPTISSTFEGTALAPAATCVTSSAYVFSTTTSTCGLQFLMQTF